MPAVCIISSSILVIRSFFLLIVRIYT
jgi:hypothetical protein